MLVGILWALLAGLMLGLYAIPGKYTKDFKEENTWGLFFMLTMFVVPILATLVIMTVDGGWMEVHSFEIDRYTKRGLVLDNHRAVAPDTPGIGVEFDWNALSPFQVAGESLEKRLL